MDDDNVLNTLIEFHKNNQWKNILNYKKNCPVINFDWAKLLWAWPDETSLYFIKRNCRKFKLKCVTSIGCGSGLFEYLLQQCTGLTVKGIEIDQKWWESLYSPYQFLNLSFTDVDVIPKISHETALMFCYFNDKSSFQEYVKNYSGNLVIIIGPGKDGDTVTNPTPFSPDFGETNTSWTLIDSQQISESKDFIAIYNRNS